MAHEPARRADAYASRMDVGRDALAQARARSATRALGLGAEPLDRFTVRHTGRRAGVRADQSYWPSHAGELSPSSGRGAAPSGRGHAVRGAHARRTGILRRQHLHRDYAPAHLSIRNARPEGGAVAPAFLRKTVAGALLFILAAAANADDRLWILTGDVYKEDYYFGGGLIIPFWGN